MVASNDAAKDFKSKLNLVLHLDRLEITAILTLVPPPSKSHPHIRRCRKKVDRMFIIINYLEMNIIVKQSDKFILEFVI